MTIPRLAAAALLMCVSTAGWSQTSPEDHAAHHPPEQAPAAAPAAGTPDRKLMESNSDLVATRGLLERAEQAKSSADRERLLDQHLAAMRKQLATLKSQQCEMKEMDGGSMSGSRADAAKPGKMDEDMKMGEGMKMGDGMKGDHRMMCHQMMKARMDTIAELLEQTWRREELRKKGAK